MHMAFDLQLLYLDIFRRVIHWIFLGLRVLSLVADLRVSRTIICIIIAFVVNLLVV